MREAPRPDDRGSRWAPSGPGRGGARAKQRLDVALVERRLVSSREQARGQILAGAVAVGGAVLTKAGALVSAEAPITLRAAPAYVSRGGTKLAHALERFEVRVAGGVALDAGAATGGFTDCLLQQGARRVYAVDVGYGQLDWRLRQDPRVVVLERTNLRYLSALPELLEVATLDLSFISLRLVLEPVRRLLRPGGAVVALIKPQFEAGREDVGRGGVVRDGAVRASVLRELLAWTMARGFAVRGLTASPLLGPAGNAEFLVHLERGDVAPGESLVGATTDQEALIVAALTETPRGGSPR